MSEYLGFVAKRDITGLTILEKIVFDLGLLRRNREEARGVFVGASIPLLPEQLRRLLDIGVDVVSKMYEKVGIELQDCIPDRLSSHNRTMYSPYIRFPACAKHKASSFPNTGAQSHNYYYQVHQCQEEQM